MISAAGFRGSLGGEIAGVIASAYLSAAFGVASGEFLKARIIPERSNMGSSRSRAGVSGMPTANEPLLGYREQFLNCRDSAVGLSCLC